jgi:hypothetical protein
VQKLGLGVFESRNAAGAGEDNGDSDESMSSSGSYSSDSTSDSDSDSIISDASDDENEDGDVDPITAVLSRPVKSLPKRARPSIVVLDDIPAASNAQDEET